MTDDMAAIAKGLTKAQREAVLGARMRLFERCYCMDPHRSRNKLIAAGLVSATPVRSMSSGKPTRANRLTPLGLQVREYLARAGGPEKR